MRCRTCSPVCLIFAVLALGTRTARAQNAVAAPDPPTSFGTVTGHVRFSGSNAPARLVNIALQPLEIEEPKRFQPGHPPALGFRVYQTGLDGSYVIAQVAPGSYFVVVNEPGFLSPFAQFTEAELAHPSPETARRMANVLPVVSVRPNATATFDVELQRGASVSGVVRFDDGTHFIAAGVYLQRHMPDGKWVGPHSYGSRAMADVDGHWQASGLPPGEYRMRVQLSVNDRRQSSLLSDSSSSSGTDMFNLNFFSGDTARERDAKSFKLEENEQRTGTDLVIPVSRLHTVAGAVVDAATGRALNAGEVELYYTDDSSYLTSTRVDPDTRTFTFNFVPEGSYTMRVANAREVRLDPPAPDDLDVNFPDRNRRQTTLRAFGPGELPLVLQGDATALTLPVSANP